MPTDTVQAGKPATMTRVWLVTNTASGSTSDAVAARVEQALAAAGATLVGCTAFPGEPLPGLDELDAAGADTAALLAGDGTINAAACALARWPGALLILPGGTMNILARALHGDADPVAIVAAVASRGRRIALPTVAADGHCAFVGLILGPAASWTWVRERVRARHWHRLGRALRHAWGRTFGRGLRLAGLPLRAQAVFVQPGEDALRVAAVEARDWRSIAGLGWTWLTGDWLAAAAVRTIEVPRFALAPGRPVTALFDGELVVLPPGTAIVPGRSEPIFLSTSETAS